MNPFSSYFHDLRRRYGVSQKELARLLGYEQGYISGLEIGRKGPPNEEFIEKLISALELDAEEEGGLRRSVEESQRKYVLPGDAPEDAFRLAHEFWRELDRLDPAQIRIIREVLRWRREQDTPVRSIGRIPNSQRQEAQM